MLRKRLLMVLGGCLLAVSTACADDVGYVDCSKHAEETQVFGKPRRTQETVATLACGERFTVLMYGFIFSRIETKDGQVGYIFSNLISVDASGATVQRRAPAAAASSAQAAAAVQPASPARKASDVTPAPAANTAAGQNAQTNWTSEPTPVTAAAPKAQGQAPAQPTDASLRVAEAASKEPKEVQPAATQAEAVSAPAPAAAAGSAPSNADAVQPSAASSAEAQPATPAPPSAQPPAPAPAAQPSAPEPSAAEAQPVRPAVQPPNVRESWEKPIPTGARRTPLMDFFGGYAFARLGSAGTATNMSGAMGSFGLNVKPWLQIVADTSYSVVTISGTKNVLYGNHYGPRIFPHGRTRFGITPFVEALFGGSRADATVSGTGGYTVSDSTFSIKAGGGFDMKVSRMFEVRVLDADYYRTSFGGVTQNNYWISTGIVLRLFGGRSE